jgi:pimeloyl-ACP methyl ester carboxylesterase
MVTKNGISGSKMVVYDKCGHFPWIEKKEEVINELQEFFPETHSLH